MDRGTLNPGPEVGKSRAEEPRIDGDSTLQIPDHKLLRRIGKGSYGEVWLARHTFGAYRAIKIVFRKSFKEHRPFERELSGICKFEPISRSHEGFVDILHVGINEAEGYFYYVMELADDETRGQNVEPESYSPKTLAKELGPQGKLAVQDCLRLGLELSAALAQLHKHGLVHRDIKPSNIIFVNGVPKLADIGLVAAIDEARSYVGTPGFIPPEGPGSPGADVYSLGKVLYEASTGKDRQEFPDLPTQWDKLPDHDLFFELNEVIVHACKTDVRDRYKSAWDMHADLVALANGKSIRRLKVLELRFSRIKKGTLIGLCIGGVVTMIAYPLYREWKVSTEFRQRQAGAHIERGTRLMESRDLLGSLPHFAEALALDNGDPARELSHRLRLGSVLAQCPKLIQFWSLSNELCTTRFSPDGQQVLIGERAGKVQIFDLATSKPTSVRFGHATFLQQCVFSRDGKYILTASEDKTARIWRITDGTELLRFEHPERVLGTDFSADGIHIVTACEDKIARVWNIQTHQCEFLLKGHTGAVIFVAFSRDGQRIVTCGCDNTVRIWDGLDGHAICAPLRHQTWARSANFSPDRRRIATACFDRKARVWDAETGKPISAEMLHDDNVSGVEYGSSGNVILTGCFDHTARLWDAGEHQPVHPVSVIPQSDRVVDINFHPDGHRVVIGCLDGSVRVWDLAGGMIFPQPTSGSFSEDKRRFLTNTDRELHVRETSSNKMIYNFHPPDAVHYAKLSRNGRFLLTSVLQDSNSGNQKIEIRKIEDGSAIGPAVLVPVNLTNFCVSEDGGHLIAFGGTIAQTWNTRAGTPAANVTNHSCSIESAIFNHVGSSVAAWSSHVVRVWNPDTGRELFHPLKHTFPVRCCQFSPDDSTIATCGADAGFTKCPAYFWNAQTGKAVGSPLIQGDGILFGSFSHDGKKFVTASEDYTAMVWEVASGRKLTAVMKHNEKVQTAVFSDDDRWILTASSDKTARVWSAETGDPLTPPLEHFVPLAGANFLDRSHIITFEDGGVARIWELPVTEKSVEDLRLLAGFLSGDPGNASSGLISRQFASLTDFWNSFRKKYPSDFKARSEEIAFWEQIASKRDSRGASVSNASTNGFAQLQQVTP